MARTNRLFNDRKEELTQYALELFLEKTYEKTTTRDVMELAGISQGALYHYFHSKEDMLDAVINHMAQQAYNSFAWVDDGTVAADDKFLKIFSAATDYLMQPKVKEINIHIKANQNSLFYYRSLVGTQKIVRELLYKTISQGNSENLFKSVSPETHSIVIQSLLENIDFFAEKELFYKNAEEIINLIQLCLKFKDSYKDQLYNLLLMELQKIRSTIYED